MFTIRADLILEFERLHSSHTTSKRKVFLLHFLLSYVDYIQVWYSLFAVSIITCGVPSSALISIYSVQMKHCVWWFFSLFSIFTFVRSSLFVMLAQMLLQFGRHKQPLKANNCWYSANITKTHLNFHWNTLVRFKCRFMCWIIKQRARDTSYLFQPHRIISTTNTFCTQRGLCDQFRCFD